MWVYAPGAYFVCLQFGVGQVAYRGFISWKQMPAVDVKDADESGETETVNLQNNEMKD